MKRRQSVVVVVGTRPEAVKLAPVVHRLKASRSLRPVLLATSQHTHQLHPILADFGLKAAQDLKVMRSGQSLSELTGRLITRLSAFLQEQRPAAVLVQGDTTTAFVGGLAAFYQGVSVGHVEAGLRTGDLAAPFPEEMNRKLLAVMAHWHFAPTVTAVRNLRREGVASADIYRTGNTVVDALQWMLPRIPKRVVEKLMGKENRQRRLVLVTCHRRENLGRPLRSITSALKRLALEHPELVVLFPVHLNPSVGSVVRPALKGLPNVVLCPPLDYPQFLACMKAADLILTDSGGVQEEATVLGKPVIVLRDRTEREEGVKQGCLTLSGTRTDDILKACEGRLASPPRPPRRMSKVFGDGQAASRIVEVLEKQLGG